MAMPVHPLLTRDTPVILAPASHEPYTTPSLTANLVCRVTLAIVANLACLVPLRNLYRNNEFAVVVYIVNVLFKNFETILHSLLWRNDNLGAWWPGYGLCDATPYAHNFSLGLFVTTLLAIMRNIAHQVGLLRAHPLSVREKRKRNLVQALIMFPLPVLQAALTWPLTMQRYAVGTLIGCAWVGYSTWQYLVFFILAPGVVAIITAGYAILTFFRFRQLNRTTESALSSNRAANMRSQRTKRRLYLMVVSILVPFLPIVLALMGLNLAHMGPIKPFDYDAIHSGQDPYPWNSIIYLPSSEIDWPLMYNAYIPIFAVVPLFLYFGMTKDAINDYRRILLFLGLGRPFPGLHQEYDPDRGLSLSGNSSTGSSNLLSGTSSLSGKIKYFTPAHRLTSMTSSSGGSSKPQQSPSPLSFSYLESGQSSRIQRPQPSQPASRAALDREDPPVQLPHRSPFLFRTRFDFPIPLVLPPFGRSAARRDKGKQPASPEGVPLEPLSQGITQPPWDVHPEKTRVQTRVWSSEETGATAGQHQPGRRDSHRHHRHDSSGSTALAETGAATSLFQGVVVETALTRESHCTGEQ